MNVIHQSCYSTILSRFGLPACPQVLEGNPYDHFSAAACLVFDDSEVAAMRRLGGGLKRLLLAR